MAEGGDTIEGVSDGLLTRPRTGAGPQKSRSGLKGLNRGKIIGIKRRGVRQSAGEESLRVKGQSAEQAARCRDFSMEQNRKGQMERPASTSLAHAPLFRWTGG